MTGVDADIRDFAMLRGVIWRVTNEVIVHLAAKAGVRPSIQDPTAYQEVNARGAQNLLELAKMWDVEQFIFASSSSVYGVNPNVPWRETDHVLLPLGGRKVHKPVKSQSRRYEASSLLL